MVCGCSTCSRKSKSLVLFLELILDTVIRTEINDLQAALLNAQLRECRRSTRAENVGELWRQRALLTHTALVFGLGIAPVFNKPYRLVVSVRQVNV